MHDHSTSRISPEGTLPESRSGVRRAPTLHEFCPRGGLQGDTARQYDEEVRCLLLRRLRGAALLAFSGFAVFLVRELLLRLRTDVDVLELASWPSLVGHLVATIVLGGVAGVMYSGWFPRLRDLRLLEWVIFGVPALYFVWGPYWDSANVIGDDPEAARAFLIATVIPWLILMEIYALFVPNCLSRAVGVISVMAVTPLVGAALIAATNESVATALSKGVFSAMVLWLSLGAVVGAYGSHRFGKLRRDVFDAGRLGSYHLKQKLGSGGMGDVYLAEHRMLKRPCAIKLIKPEMAGDVKALARFESEVQAAAGLTHPNTIEIYDYGRTDDGMFYYAMEFLPGLNLQELVELHGPLPPERVVYLLRQVCSALREAHQAGLIHRDIKPGNIFAAERGGLYDVAKLLDFGLVKSSLGDVSSPKLTLDGTVVGSPLYSAPEASVEGQPDERSDIYSLGATAYFLLTGQPVFAGDNVVKILFAHATDTPVVPSQWTPDIPGDLESIVMKCLEKKSSERFVEVKELDDALAATGSADGWTQARAARWWLQRPSYAVAESESAAAVAATAVMQVDA